MPEGEVTNDQVFDCLVLSGGGAKGAYGAGTAKALHEYYKLKNIAREVCYIGTSAGALNAAVLACKGPDALIALWQAMSNRSVLGVNITNQYFRLAARSPWLLSMAVLSVLVSSCLNRWLGPWSSKWLSELLETAIGASWARTMGTILSFGSLCFAGTVLGVLLGCILGWLCKRRLPFSVFDNHALWTLIKDHVRLDELRRKHLIISVTNYTTGTLRAGFVSDLIPHFVKHDEKQDLQARRIEYFRAIDDDAHLTGFLLASSAIPFGFPPVLIDGHWYIDGGVGNNTPTREAAYFLRHLKELGLGIPGEVYCVKMDPQRTLLDEPDGIGPLSVIMRSLDVYHHLHIEPIIKSWHKINTTVKERDQAIGDFNAWLAKRKLDDDLRKEVMDRVSSTFGRLGSSTGRLDVPLHEIEPSRNLGSTLEFDHNCIIENIKHGYADMLNRLLILNKIDHAEHERLGNLPLFSLGT